MSKLIKNGQMARDEVLAKLDEGTVLYSLTTENLYKRVKGQLMRLTKTSNGWENSDLIFMESPSWTKMRVYDSKNKTDVRKKGSKQKQRRNNGC